MPIALKILVASRYNNERHEAADYQPGDILITGPDYGASLVESKLAEYASEQPEPEPTPAKKPNKKAGKPAPAAKSGPSNPFVP